MIVADYEAETATLGGAVPSRRNGGFSAYGYADFIHADGDYVAWHVVPALDGMYRLDFRYANGSASDRPLDLTIDWKSVERLSFPPTGSWSKWATVSTYFDVPLHTAGTQVVLYAVGSSGPNLDKLRIESLFPPPPDTQAAQAEDVMLSGAVPARGNGGFEGAGYADYVNASGDFLEWAMRPVLGGRYELGVRYANGSSRDRPLELSVDGFPTGQRVSLPPTAGGACGRKRRSG